MSDPVAVAVYLTPPVAHMLRGRLESEEIPAFVVDEDSYRFALGTGTGVRVLVR